MFKIHVNEAIRTIQKPGRVAKPVDPRVLVVGVVRIAPGQDGVVASDVFLRNRRWLRSLEAAGLITISNVNAPAKVEVEKTSEVYFEEPVEKEAPATEEPPAALPVEDEKPVEGVSEAVVEPQAEEAAGETESPKESISSMGVKELRALCEENGIDTTSLKKAGLIEALHAKGLE